MPSSIRALPVDRLRPLRDLLLVSGVSAAAFAGELALAEQLPWGDAARGVVAVLTGAAVAVWLNHAGGGSLAELGLRRPQSWLTAAWEAAAVFGGFVLAQGLLPWLVAPFSELPAPDLSRYDAVRGNLPAAVGLALALPLMAAIPEEVLYRGFLIGRLQRLLGGGRGSVVSAVLLQALIFGSIHFQWGPGGMVFAALMGGVWGFAYLLCGRNLWILIIAHSLGHLALVAQLYTAPPPPP